MAPGRRQPADFHGTTLGRSVPVNATLVLAAVLSSGCKGCGSKAAALADAPVLASVTVQPVAPVVTSGQAISVDVHSTQEKIQSILDRAGLFGSAEAKRPNARATLQAELIDATSSSEPAIGVKVRFRVAIRPADSAAAHFAEDAEAMGEVPLPDADAGKARVAFQRLLDRTSEDVAKSYVARQRLWRAAPAEIASALDSTDNDLRLDALRIVAARKVPGQADKLLRMLSDEDENVRDAALGAVVSLHEGRAVKVLTQSRSMRDTREMQKILSALAVLGGAEARDYLSFVAQNHDDDDVRAMAKQALEALDRSRAHVQTTK
jgi:hypothetical protein